MECLCHKWPRMCFVCCNHTPVLSLFMVYHTTQRGATCGASTAYSSGTLEFAPFFTCLNEVRAVHFIKSRVFICLVPCPIRLPRKNNVRFVLTHICFVRGFTFYLCYLYLFTHTDVQHDFNIRWCSHCNNMTGVICGTGSANTSVSPEFLQISVNIFYCSTIMQIIRLDNYITIWLYIILTTGFGNKLINGYCNQFQR